MKIFETVLTESPLPFIKYYKKDIEITGTTTNPGKINYLRNLLPGEVICKFDTLENVNAGISNAHSQYIVQGLLKYSPPENYISNQNHRRLGPAQDVHFLYTRSHLSAIKSCALIFSTNFYLFSYLNSERHNLVIELCSALKII